MKNFASNVENAPPVPEEIAAQKSELLKEIASLGISIEDMRKKQADYPEIQKNYTELEEKMATLQAEFDQVTADLVPQKLLHEQTVALVTENVEKNEKLLADQKVIEEKNESLREESKKLKEEKFAIGIETAEVQTELDGKLIEIDKKDLIIEEKENKIKELDEKAKMITDLHNEKVAQQKSDRDLADKDLEEVQKTIKKEKEAMALEKAEFASESKLIKETLEQSKMELKTAQDAIPLAKEEASAIKATADQYSIDKKAELELQEQELIKREGAANFLATSTEEKLERARLTKAELEKIHGRQFPHLIF